MSSQFWVVKLADDSLHTIGYSGKPDHPDYIEVVAAPIDILTGLAEEGIWLQLEDIEQPGDPGNFILTATVDEALKANILAQREVDRLANEAEDDTKVTAFKDLKTKIKDLKKSDLTSAESIKDAIIDLQTFVLEIEKRLLNIVLDDKDKDK